MFYSLVYVGVPFQGVAADLRDKSLAMYLYLFLCIDGRDISSQGAATSLKR